MIAAFQFHHDVNLSILFFKSLLQTYMEKNNVKSLSVKTETIYIFISVIYMCISVSLKKDFIFQFHIYFSASFAFYILVSHTYSQTRAMIYLTLKC